MTKGDLLDLVRSCIARKEHVKTNQQNQHYCALLYVPTAGMGDVVECPLSYKPLVSVVHGQGLASWVNEHYACMREFASTTDVRKAYQSISELKKAYDAGQ